MIGPRRRALLNPTRPDPKAPANPAPQSMPGQGGKGWQGLNVPGVFRLELGPGVEDFFRIIQDPGVPA